MLDIEDYHTYFDSGDLCKIAKKSLVVSKEQTPTTLYKVFVKLCKEEVNGFEDASNDLWHTCFGHLSDKGLNIIINNFFLSVINTPIKTCTDCFSGKQNRVSF